MSEDQEESPAEPKRKLEWGQTPWDGMSREEILLELQRYHSALEAAAGVLRDRKLGDPHPYWSEGPGGRAIAKAEQVAARLAGFDSSSLYRAFFRYADDLLFDGLGDGWVICDRCQCLRAPILPDAPLDEKCCPDCKRKGFESRLRPITWEDLEPLEAGP